MLGCLKMIRPAAAVTKSLFRHNSLLNKSYWIGRSFNTTNSRPMNTTLRCFSTHSDVNISDSMDNFQVPTIDNVFPSDMSIMDREKEMFKTKRRCGVLYSQGKYADALHHANVRQLPIHLYIIHLSMYLVYYLLYIYFSLTGYL